MSIQSDKALDEALKFIESCNFTTPLAQLKKILVGELHDKRLVYAIRCCDFWSKYDDSIAGTSHFEHGEWLMSQWKQFQPILELADRKSVV